MKKNSEKKYDFGFDFSSKNNQAEEKEDDYFDTIEKERKKRNDENYKLALEYWEAGMVCAPQKSKKEKHTIIAWKKEYKDLEKPITKKDYKKWHKEGLWKGGICCLYDFSTKKEIYENDLVCLDFDKEGGIELFNLLPDWAKNTWTVKTTSGGYHLIFRWPTKLLTSKARTWDAVEHIGLEQKGGVDVKAHGGLSVLPSYKGDYNWVKKPKDKPQSLNGVFILMYLKKLFDIRYDNGQFSEQREYFNYNNIIKPLADTGVGHDSVYAFAYILCNGFSLPRETTISILTTHDNTIDSDDLEGIINDVYDNKNLIGENTKKLSDWFISNYKTNSSSLDNINNFSICDWSEDEVAELFVANYNDWRYTIDGGKYYNYETGVWREDESLVNIGNEFKSLMEDCVSIKKDELRNTPPDDDDYKEKQKAVNAVQKYRNGTSRKKAVENASIISGIYTAEETFDQNKFYLNFKNGFYDLETHNFVEDREEQKKAMFTKQLPFDYDPTAKCPLTLDFLELCLGDLSDSKEVIDFMKIMSGYMLTGSTDQEAIFILHGSGNNGKTTFIDALTGSMSDYSTTVPESFLKYTYNDTHPTELLTIKGARVAIAEEIQGQRFNLQRLKLLCSKNPTLKVRGMGQDFFDMDVHAKIIASCNVLPKINEQTKAVFRRIYTIPFSTDIVKKVEAQGGEEIKDFYLSLLSERMGIINWAIEGWRELQRIGSLPKIDSITVETQKLIDGSDPLSEFIEEYCTVKEGYYVSKSDLYSAYNDIYDDAIGRNTFYETMEQKGFEIKRDPSKESRKKCYIGIALSEDRRNMLNKNNTLAIEGEESELFGDKNIENDEENELDDNLDDDVNIDGDEVLDNMLKGLGNEEKNDLGDVEDIVKSFDNK